MLSSAVILEFCIGWIAKRGAITNISVRKPVRPFLYIRCGEPSISLRKGSLIHADAIHVEALFLMNFSVIFDGMRVDGVWSCVARTMLRRLSSVFPESCFARCVTGLLS